VNIQPGLARLVRLQSPFSYLRPCCHCETLGVRCVVAMVSCLGLLGVAPQHNSAQSDGRIHDLTFRKSPWSALRFLRCRVRFVETLLDSGVRYRTVSVLQGRQLGGYISGIISPLVRGLMGFLGPLVCIQVSVWGFFIPEGTQIR
jgi:hypothetical protein